MKTNFLTIPSILSLSFREIYNRFRYFFLLALIGPVCAWVLQGAINGFDPLQTASQDPAFFKMICFSGLAMFISVWAWVALVLFVCKRTDSFGDLFILSLKRLPRLIAGLLIYTLLTALYILLFVLLITCTFWILGTEGPGTTPIVIVLVLLMSTGLAIALVYLVLLPYLLILTDIPLLTTFPAAFTLVKNHFWHTLGLLLLVGIISGVIYTLMLLALGIVSLVFYWILPPTRYFFYFLSVIPAALVLLINQVPLIALYIDRNPLLEEMKKTTND